MSRARYRLFDAIVVAIERLSPSYIRVTFGGDDLRDFGSEGLDQRIKVVLPNALGGYPQLDVTDTDWFTAWRTLPDEERPPLRTYTVRRISGNGDRRLVEVDFVLHGDGGPASRWVRQAATGDRMALFGPDATSGGPWGGVAWNPPAGSSRFVLAGDETAAPAIAAVLESLPDGTDARAFIEIPSAEDELEIALPAGVELTWLPRVDGVHGSRLRAAVIDAIPVPAEPVIDPRPATGPRNTDPENTDLENTAEENADEEIWEVPGLDPETGMRVPETASGELYAWLAGESSVIRGLRRHLVQGVGIDKHSVAFMGYWKEGEEG